MLEKRKIITLRHPQYNRNFANYCKWRLTMDSGDVFKNTYLKKFSIREDENDFKERREISYVTSFAAAAVTEIVNAIYQRMGAIKRIGGPKTYQDAVIGLEGGVDLYGASMNTFIGQEVIIELLSMKKVGVFIDRPKLMSNVLSDVQGKNPFCFIYKAEDLLTWNTTRIGCENVYTSILLRDWIDEIDEETGLVADTGERYRQMWLTQEGVYVQMWNSKSEMLGEKILIPGMKRIPFVEYSLNKSLLTDAAGYQIALMNLSSSDLAYVLKANHPFYTEQVNALADSAYLKQSQMLQSDGNGQPGAADQEIKVGTTRGRKYPMGADRPDFIHPSSEPLLASMKKQDQMKDEIRQLVNLSLASVKSTHASAESKGMDDRSLEGGLAAIGLELEHGENQIAKIWAMYEGAEIEPAQVKYPTTYSMLTPTERSVAIKQLQELRDEAPSNTYRKEVCKKLARLVLETDVSDDIITKIDKEIDSAEYMTSNADDIRNDVETGLVSAITASNARGYDGKKEVPIAQTEHADRLARISAAQGGTNLDPNAGSNGNSDKTSGTGQDGSINKIKVPPDQNPTTKQPVRGAAK